MKIFDYLKNPTRLKIAYFLFATVIIFSQIFYSYRYILMLGSEVTSKNYHETPTSIESIKYFVFVAFYIATILLLFPYLKKLYIERIRPYAPFFVVVLAFSGLLFIKLALGKFHLSDFAITQDVKLLFVVPIVFLVPILITKFPKALLHGIFVFSLAYNLIYDAIQVILFYTVHRLPSLGFGPLFPRYGGGWDDPNAFAAFAILLLTIWIVYGYKKSKVIDLSMIVILTLATLLTYSITALLGLVVIVVALFVLNAADRIKLFLVAATVIAFGLYHYLAGLVPLLILAKQESSVGHLAKVSATGGGAHLPAFIVSLVGPLSGPIFHENLYIQLFNSVGVVGVALFILIILSTIFAALRGYLIQRSHGAGESDYSKFYAVAIAFIAAFAVMNVGIPHLQVFPINLFAWLIIGLVWAFSQTTSWKEMVGLDIIEKLRSST